MAEHAHLEELIRALDAEERWQRKEHAAQLALDLPDRVAVGLSWSGLTLSSEVDAGRGRVDVVLRAPRGTVLHDGIGSGDLVRVAPVGAPDEGPLGPCLAVEGDAAEVRLDEPLDGPGPYAVTRMFDPRTYARYRDALDRADQASSRLRDVLLGTREPTPALAHGAGADLQDLNPSQAEAAEMALRSSELALIHGPPGTGKTQTITALLRALVAQGDRPWALADSNTAVDHLAWRASRAGLDTVRIGHPARIGSEILPLTLDARISRSPLGPVLRDLDKAIARLRRETSREGRKERRELLAERDALHLQARDGIVREADVLAVTFGTLARVAQDLPRPHTAVVDEASQAIEPAVWTAVPFVDRLVLVGDPNQLGPVVFEPGNRLGRSLLERLLALGRVPMPMLRVQYRMNRAIESLVDHVYADALEAHASVAGHRLADLPGVAGDLAEHALLWVDTAGAGFEEARDPVSRSLYNEGEARVVALALRRLRESGVRPEDIGVITPYSAAVARLRALPECEGVEVHTVNAFQGREKEAILVSFVRSNPDAEVGFVSDPRRLVVALTRARRFLLCTGDSTTLGSVPGFATVMDRFHALDAWKTVWEPPWDGVVAG